MIRTLTIYALLYIALTFGDMWSTHLGLAAGAQEFNPNAADADGGLALTRFWLLNIGMLAASTSMLFWALKNRAFIAEKYLRNPVLASMNWIYLNPFSEKSRARSALHFIALPLCLLGAKLIAIGSNLRIASGHGGIFDPVVLFVSGLVDGAAVYWVTIFIVFTPLFIVMLYIAAAIVKRLENEPGATAKLAGATA